MNVAEFEDCIDRLGEDMSLWPDAQRVAAVELLESSDQARALLAEAEVLRNALSGSPIRAPAGLADRIVSAALQQAPVRPAPEHDEADACVDNSGQP